MNKSENIDLLATALSKAQAEIVGAKKDSQNPFFKSSYADLHSVIEAIREPFAKNGLSYSQLTDFDEKGTFVETILMHSSGQWLISSYPIISVKPDPQSMLAALTYARRGCLSAISGVAQIDDDGNTASNREIVKENANTTIITDKPQTTFGGGYVPRDKPATEKQISLIYGVGKRNNYQSKDVLELIHEKYKLTSDSQLNQIQINELIEYMAKNPKLTTRPTYAGYQAAKQKIADEPPPPNDSDMLPF